MKNCIAMTLYDRNPLTVANTLASIAKAAAGIPDTEVLIVDDASSVDYSALILDMSTLGTPIRVVRCDTCSERAGTYNLNGYNNPAYASNFALRNVDSEFLFWMSSDVILTPPILREALKLNLNKVVWMPCVVDLDTQGTFLGPDRLAPFGWFMATATEHFRATGWDEEYLKGLAFEDNDFTARLAIEVGRVVVDTNCTVWHQSHRDIAYSDDMRGFQINQAYTKQKWGSIPWETVNGALKVKTAKINHQIILDVSRPLVAVN